MEIKEEYKPYLFGGACLLAAIYFFAYLLLALATSINDIAGYPIYNFLGSEVDLRPAVLQLLPAQNPAYLPKWNALPLVNFMFATIAFTTLVFMNCRFMSQIKKEGPFKLISFVMLASASSIIIFSDVYGEIFILTQSLVNTAK